MSSPVMSPPPVGAFRRGAAGLIAGPFVLIVIGFMFLLGTMHVLSVGRLAHLVRELLARTADPLGRDQGARAQQAQREGTRASGIGAGGVVLVVMIVVFGLIATQTGASELVGTARQFQLR